MSVIVEIDKSDAAQARKQKLRRLLHGLRRKSAQRLRRALSTVLNQDARARRAAVANGVEPYQLLGASGTSLHRAANDIITRIDQALIEVG